MEKNESIKEVIKLMRKIDRTRRQYELDTWMDLPLSIAQLKSLFFISNHGSTNLGNLAAALHVTSTNTTGIIDRLVKQGLVSRTEDERDRRMLLLKATPEGEALVTKLREKRHSYLTASLGLMTSDDIVTLQKGLAAFIAATEQSEEQH